MSGAPATEKQVGMLSFMFNTLGLTRYFKQHVEGGADLTLSDSVKWCRKYLTTNEASMVIGLLNGEDPKIELAIGRLRGLGLPMEEGEFKLF